MYYDTSFARIDTPNSMS